MKLQVGVKILFKNSDGKFLLVRRNPKKYPEVGPKWDCPAAGLFPHVPIDNLKREIKEEVSLNYIGEPKLVAAQDILKSADKHVVRLTYLGRSMENPKSTTTIWKPGGFPRRRLKKWILIYWTVF